MQNGISLQKDLTVRMKNSSSLAISLSVADAACLFTRAVIDPRTELHAVGGLRFSSTVQGAVMIECIVRVMK